MSLGKAILCWCMVCLGAVAGMVLEHNFPSAGPHHFEERLRAVCVKCGSPAISLRHCTDRCTTPGPRLDLGPGRGSLVVWGHEHLHRICTACGYAGDAMECRDHEQP